MGPAKLRGARSERVVEAKNLLLRQMAELDEWIKSAHPKNRYRREVREAQWQRLYQRYAHAW
jgi:hypothetical protein